MKSASYSSHRRGPLLRKSRSGCRDCRVRKVKCDEIQPVCSNCRRRYVNIQVCDWSTELLTHGSAKIAGETTPQLAQNLAAYATSKHTSVEYISSLSLNTTSIPSTNRWRSLELRLMYHYSSVVSFSMPGCNGASKEAWRRTIPQLSFDSELLLNPMLALSALHLHSHSQSNNDPHIEIALRRYLDLALVNHRKALSSQDKTQSEQMWLSSVLLSHMYWLLAHQQQPGQAYELPLQAMKMLEGAQVIFRENHVSLSQQDYGWLGDEPAPPILPEDELSQASQTQLRNLEEDLENLLDAFEVQKMEDERKSIYIEAKNFALHHYRAFYSGADAQMLERFVAFMAVRCQPGYLTLLETHDPLAMALMARMLVLLSRLDHAWWVHGEGDYEAIHRDIRGICGLMPDKLRWVMDWPCKILNRDIVFSRG